MPYRLVKNARNTLRPVVRWRGVRGLGDDISDINASGDLNNLYIPGGPNENTTLDLGGNYQQPTVFPIGSTQGCGAGYVVADSAGNCVPIGSPGAPTPTYGNSTAGIIQAAANATTAAAKALTTPTSGVIPVVSTNPFASISPTLLLAAGGLLFVVLLMKKR